MAMILDRPQLLTTAEAAEYLQGIATEGTLAVWRSTRRHVIPYVKVGRNIRYRREDLDRWLASRTVGAVEDQD